MIVKLFDVQNDKVVPTEHCYALPFLKTIMDEYPDNYLQIYQYVFYMTCPNPDMNPFFHTPEHEKEEVIMKEVEGDFSTEDDDVWAALKFCEKMYQTPTSRAYKVSDVMSHNIYGLPLDLICQPFPMIRHVFLSLDCRRQQGYSQMTVPWHNAA